MDADEFKIFLNQTFSRLCTIRAQAQKEYARDSNNVFANFDRIGASLRLPPEQVLLVYLLKHIDGICSHVSDGLTSQRDSIEGRIDDAVLYLLLLQGMLKRD